MLFPPRRGLRMQPRTCYVLWRLFESVLRVWLMKKSFLLWALCLLSVNSCFASHIYLEKDYQNHWCKANNGITEHILPDSARVDCLTKDYAIEFDFATKWAESIGQALYYAACTGKNAGVVLIMEKPQKDERYLSRLNAVAQKYNIKIWTMTPNDIPAQKYKKRVSSY